MRYHNKGFIALDIDGTITASRAELTPAVNSYLNELIQAGWCVIFLTGRTYSFAKPVLKNLKGPYAIGVQNGAALIQDEKVLSKKYLKLSDLTVLLPYFDQTGFGLHVESGIESGDISHYRAHDFSDEEFKYLLFRQTFTPEHWRELSTFENLKLPSFACVKFFSNAHFANDIKSELQDLYQVTTISDPFRPGFSVTHINADGVSKARALQEFIKNQEGPVIAAGDDDNDIEMLKMADIKIVMQHAPAYLREMADIVAPPVKEDGVIAALKEALLRL